MDFLGLEFDSELELESWLKHGATNALVALVFILFCTYVGVPLLRHWRRIKQLRAIPYGETPHWFWGHTQRTLKRDQASERWKRWMRVSTRMVKAVFLTFPRISLCHPETACAVLQTGAAKRRSPLVYGMLKPWIGDVAGELQGAGHRRLLSEVLARRDHLGVYGKATAEMLDSWSEAAEKRGSHGDDLESSVNATRACALLAMDILLRCAVGYSSGCQVDTPGGEGAMFVENILGALGCMEERLLSASQRNNFVFRWSGTGRRFARHKRQCDKMMERIISERRCQRQERLHQKPAKSTSERLDMLDALLTVVDRPTSSQMSSEALKKIRDTVYAVIFQGHDTTTSALQWSLYYLAKHPELQERCRREVQRELGGENKKISLERLARMQYLTQFLNETIRLSATVPFAALTLSKSVKIDGHVLPEGTWISIPILAIHQNPDVWEDPLEFDPDRFDPKETEKRHPLAFMPFLDGPCECIGRQMATDIVKTVLSLVLLKFRLRVGPTLPTPRYLGSFTSKSTVDIRFFVDEIQ